MKCPKCNGDTRVIDCVFNKYKNEYYRTRQCKECEERFHTVEILSDESADFIDTFYALRRRKIKPKQQRGN